jgi:hypothetical protein
MAGFLAAEALVVVFFAGAFLMASFIAADFSADVICFFFIIKQGHRVNMT